MLSIILPTKKRVEIFYETIECLDKILKLFDHDYEVLVINNDPDPISFNLPDYVKIINCDGRGVASARNMGAHNAKGDILLFLDNDILISYEAFIKGYKLFLKLIKQNENIAINFNWIYPRDVYDLLEKNSFGRYLLYYEFDKYEGKAWTNRNFDKKVEYQKTDVFTSSTFFISKSTFNKIGGYTEDFSFAGYEDHNFREKLLKNNIDIYILTNTYVFHNERDYIDLNKFLERKYRSAFTRKQAVSLGDNELILEYSYLKKILLTIIWPLRNILIYFVNNFSQSKKFDPLMFKIIDTLLAVYIYKGYNN